MSAGAPALARSERAGGLKHRWVFLALLAGAVTVLGIFGAGYFALIHYERHAAKHLPAGTRWAVRIDVEQVVLFEPFRRHVLGELKSRGDASGSSTWLSRFERAAELSVGLDLREVVHARTEDDWFFALGGTYKNSELLRHAYEALGQRRGCELGGEGRLRCSLLGIFAQQAPDGVVLIASSEAALTSGLPQTLRHQQLHLPSEGPGGFALSADVLRSIAGGPLGWVHAEIRRLADVESLSGELSLHDNVHIVATARPKGQRSLAPLAQNADALLEGAQKLVALAPGPDFGGERAVLSRAKLEVTDRGSLVIRSQWKRSEIEQAARSIAGLLRRRL